MKYTEINGLTSDEECEWLIKQASQMNVIVEIGSYTGKSTAALASSCPGVVFAIDNFSDIIYRQFKENTKEYDNIKLIRHDSLKASTLFNDKSVDMIFLDGNHTELMVRKDVEAWFPKCKTLFCGHDLSLVESSLRYHKLDFIPLTGSLWKIIMH